GRRRRRRGLRRVGGRRPPCDLFRRGGARKARAAGLAGFGARSRPARAPAHRRAPCYAARGVIGPLNADLSEALAIRLQLQISLSILPVVEEWMDVDMNRWLESVPMPPEMAGQGQASFLVSVASDRSRVRWSAHGHPAGFVPKMAEYLSKCGVSSGDVDVINRVGEELRPERVGTWVGAAAGEMETGWHFLDERPMALLAGLLDSGGAGVSLLEWSAAVGVSVFHRYSRAI